MKKDTLFAKQNTPVGTFEFGKETAEVFDDMLERSIPLYKELQRMIGEIASEFAVEGTTIYDLGCSTGATLKTIISMVNEKTTFIGLDSSQAMLARCKDILAKSGIQQKYDLVCADLNDGYAIKNASVVVLNLTLQFVNPLHRERLIKNIYAGLNKNGCLLVIEKVLGNNSLSNKIFDTFYYNMKKRNGYSELEIAQKKEALENILVPYKVDENKRLLLENGFSSLDCFFKWYNFCGLIAVK